MDPVPSLDAERLALFRLSLAEGLGPVKLRALLARFRSPRGVLAASAAELAQVDGIGAALAESIRQLTSTDEAARAYQRMLDMRVRLLFEGDADYPESLREIPAAPFLLSVRGELLPRDKVAIGIVGSRHSTAYGRRMAERLAADLAVRGVTIVSGLARGIDAAAHQGALRVKGRTIAVLASGLANIYPPEHGPLADQVASAGALISEAPLDGPPLGGLFPQRNRIISGLSLGVVVVEAAARSGALSTARHALEQNREVFAVPGRVGDPSAEGTLALLKEGACLVRDVDDILSQLGPVELAPAPASAGSELDGERTVRPNLDPVQGRLWDAMGTDEVELEVLLERTGLRASEASSALLMMEMNKLARRLPGNRYARR